MKTQASFFHTVLACALGVVILLSGCAGGTKFADYHATVTAIPKGQGRVWFYRPSAIGFAVQPAVHLDGKVVGRAAPKGFFHTETAPGAHEVSVTTEMTHKTTFNLSPEQDIYVRLDMMMGVFVGHVIPRVIESERALREINNMHLVQ